MTLAYVLCNILHLLFQGTRQENYSSKKKMNGLHPYPPGICPPPPLVIGPPVPANLAPPEIGPPDCAGQYGPPKNRNFPIIRALKWTSKMTRNTRNKTKFGEYLQKTSKIKHI